MGKRVHETGPQKAVQEENKHFTRGTSLDQHGFPGPVGRPEQALSYQQLGNQATSKTKDGCLGQYSNFLQSESQRTRPHSDGLLS